MEAKNRNTNVVTLQGRIASDMVFDHETHAEKFYTFFLEVKRLSIQKDCIPIIVSENFPQIFGIEQGKYVCIQGNFRSFNDWQEGKSKLILRVFLKQIAFLEQENNENEIVLNGYICKDTIYRKTLSGREITDFILAVNRIYKKSDYIPCIAWNENARKMAECTVGMHLIVWGRIQSREYLKKLSDKQIEKRIAYEVSVSKIELESEE